MRNENDRLKEDNERLEKNEEYQKARAAIGADKVDTFAASLGLGPKYVPKEEKKEMCPKCKSGNAFYKEYHPDTDMNEILLTCPDCGFVAASQ